MTNQDSKRRFEAQYKSPGGQAFYKERKAKAEHPFGHIKRILKADSFLLRGRQAAQAESCLWATIFNLTRMITILGGVTPLLEKLRA